MSIRIIMVDDDPLILRLGEKLLTGAGYEVLTAPDGEAGIDLIRRESPDIILTDVLMPKMNGIELCAAVREFEELIGTVYLIVLSGRNAPEQLVEAFEAGADDFLGKPFNRSELIARVNAGARLVGLQKALEAKEIDLVRRTAELEVALGDLERANARLDAMATTDELTGLQNRRAAMQAIERRWAEIERDGGAMSLVMIDIDKFKSVNDTLGHDAGDVVLQHVAKKIDAASRESEESYRLGGEEFLVFCHAADEAAAAIGAERIRAAVAAELVPYGDGEIPITISLGIAERLDDTATIKDLFKAADEALYAAKEGGRNQVVCFSGADAPPRIDADDATRDDVPQSRAA